MVRRICGEGRGKGPEYAQSGEWDATACASRTPVRVIDREGRRAPRLHREFEYGDRARAPTPCNEKY
jgi:hypothetical protein